ncbi:hypothetical protein F4692_002888 [Nocardioides cavernae]|uniref:Roadblock/LAMTOR2 domain-containing protein n=1 Tax=Nocardioides cavernae TaxID=1921566 RepID=A0A7Y9H4H6_9ACTN|nr:hypothetical protein [Nocardioides cavernae]NYE37755.1 hypothetical protein [Nocardioides cavernae]
MTAELISSHRLSSGWAGRASQHRRHQVRSRTSGADGVDAMWSSVVDVLAALPGRAGAVLCTADGSSVATYGLTRGEQVRLPQEAVQLIMTHRVAERSATGVVTAEVVAGPRCTVVARIPSAARGDHLLLVTATDVSAPLLNAWTSQAAEDLRRLLLDATA